MIGKENMMRLLFAFSLIFLGIIKSSFAGKGGNELTEQDIAKSTTRITKFSISMTAPTICEQGNPVGETSFDKGEFYVTFLPSIKFEMTPRVDTDKIPLKEVGLQVNGMGQQGLTRPFSIQDTMETIIAPFNSYRQQYQVPSEQTTIIVDGVSIGAHRAILAALYMKQHLDTKDFSMIVLRYAGAITFDYDAIKSIHKILGKSNILGFNAFEDELARFGEFSSVRSSLGIQSDFSASALSATYNTRVKLENYSNLDPIDGFFYKEIITPAKWEAHQPLTYAEACPKLFDSSKGRKKETNIVGGEEQSQALK